MAFQLLVNKLIKRIQNQLDIKRISKPFKLKTTIRPLNPNNDLIRQILNGLRQY